MGLAINSELRAALIDIRYDLIALRELMAEYENSQGTAPLSATVSVDAQDTIKGPDMFKQ